jgi:hypothetical protein
MCGELINDSGEFSERNGLTIKDKESTPQQPNLPEPSRTIKAIQDTQPENMAETDWKVPSTEIVEPSQHYVTPNGPQSDLESKMVMTNEDSPYEAPQQETVQPLKVFPTQSRISENRIALVNVLAPVGHSNSAISKAEPASSQSVPRGSALVKAPRQNAVSASDATILGVVKQALAGASITDVSHDCATHQGSERNHLPNGRLSSRDPLAAGPQSAMPATNGANCRVKSLDILSPEEEDRDSEVQRKALEVLNLLRAAGFNVQKDTTYSPKPHNQGSAASLRSENQVTCQKCKRFTGRPCELKYVFSLSFMGSAYRSGNT